MSFDSSIIKSLNPANAAVLLGLLYVIIEGPYVGVAPELPVLNILIISVLFGMVLSLYDRLRTSDNVENDPLSFLRGWNVSNTLPLGFALVLPTLYWRYSNKFLGMSSEYLAKMATDIPCKTGVGCVIGAQQNLAFYPMDKMVLFFGGLILLFFMLVQNEFNQISNLSAKASSYVKRFAMDPRSGLRKIRGAWLFFIWSNASPLLKESETETKDRIDPVTGVKVGDVEVEIEKSDDSYLKAVSPESVLRDASTSLFAISVFILCYAVIPGLDLSASTQVPFLFLGAGVVSGIILLQNNLSDILSIRPGNFRDYTDGSPKSISAAVSLLTILLFVILVLNVSFIPIISQDIPSFLTLITLIVLSCWSFILSKEGAKPAVQSHRTAAFAFLVLFPFLMYLFLRVLFLQNDGTNPVMLNRWEVRYEFMDLGNTFKINPWPLDAEPNLDSRWIFLKAAILNSVRVTLVSIILCTILGIIVGVARLSSNKLTSWAATAYVEIFRNLPLAVLLFLLATQIGLQFPMMPEEKNLFGGAIYYSNKGIWFTTVASYGALAISLVCLALLRAFLRARDRVEPRHISTPSGFSLRRPFASLGWRYEPLAADLFVILSVVLLLTRVQIGEFLFTTPSGRFSPGVISESIFEALFYPFLSSLPEGLTTVDGRSNVQSLEDNVRIAIGPILGALLVVYSLLVTTNIDDDGMNSLEVDDSEEGIRARFTLWVAAFAFALGITLAGGIYEVGDALSMPDYSKDMNNDGIQDQPGSWGIVDGTGFEITPFFLAMVLGLTLFTASVVAEIVRGSIQSLPRGQVEAAISLSLNPYQRLRLVILPQALRSMIPLLNNQFMNVWKNSSLAVVVAYTDIFYVILVMMNNVGKLIPLFLLLLVTYQVGSLTISAIMNWYNSRVTSVKI